MIYSISTPTVKGNLSNTFQGKYKKVLAVCSAGLLRSPTIAHTLCRSPYKYNTRSAGTEKSYALNLITEELILWADEIVCAEAEHEITVRHMLYELGYDLQRFKKTIISLDIPDVYEYMNPKLVKLIKERYSQSLIERGEEP